MGLGSVWGVCALVCFGFGVFVVASLFPKVEATSCSDSMVSPKMEMARERKKGGRRERVCVRNGEGVGVVLLF